MTPDELQEGKIDRATTPHKTTARPEHIFVLNCPQCNLRAMATKQLACSKCQDGTVMEIENEWHITETSFPQETGESTLPSAQEIIERYAGDTDA